MSPVLHTLKILTFFIYNCTYIHSGETLEVSPSGSQLTLPSSSAEIQKYTKVSSGDPADDDDNEDATDYGSTSPEEQGIGPALLQQQQTDDAAQQGKSAAKVSTERTHHLAPSLPHGMTMTTPSGTPVRKRKPRGKTVAATPRAPVEKRNAQRITMATPIKSPQQERTMTCW